MKGTRIIVSSPPRGVFEDVIVSGTPKPGTVMEITRETAAVGGAFTYVAAGNQAASGGHGMAADGDKIPIAILVEKNQEGGTYDDAYADGDRGKIYWPVNGEEFNMILENQSGTGEDFAIGDALMVDDGTGKLLEADSDAEAHAFQMREAQSALAADTHARVQYTPGA